VDTDQKGNFVHVYAVEDELLDPLYDFGRCPEAAFLHGPGTPRNQRRKPALTCAGLSKGDFHMDEVKLDQHGRAICKNPGCGAKISSCYRDGDLIVFACQECGTCQEMPRYPARWTPASRHQAAA